LGTNNNPTIDLSTKTVDGSGTGIFTSDISGLAAGTTYYVRAYATNSFGTSYGNQIIFNSSVTDVDGNVYGAVKIGKFGLKRILTFKISERRYYTSSN
jgi:hypothetical protein